MGWNLNTVRSFKKIQIQSFFEVFLFSLDGKEKSFAVRKKKIGGLMF